MAANFKIYTRVACLHLRYSIKSWFNINTKNHAINFHSKQYAIAGILPHFEVESELFQIEHVLRYSPLDSGKMDHIKNITALASLHLNVLTFLLGYVDILKPLFLTQFMSRYPSIGEYDGARLKDTFRRRQGRWTEKDVARCSKAVFTLPARLFH